MEKTKVNVYLYYYYILAERENKSPSYIVTSEVRHMRQHTHAVMHMLLQVLVSGMPWTKAACTDFDMSDPKQVDTN